MAEYGASDKAVYCNEGLRLSWADCGGVCKPPYDNVLEGLSMGDFVSIPGMIRPRLIRVGVDSEDIL